MHTGPAGISTPWIVEQGPAQRKHAVRVCLTFHIRTRPKRAHITLCPSRLRMEFRCEVTFIQLRLSCYGLLNVVDGMEIGNNMYFIKKK
jgi:hypothetical protein